VPRHDTFHPSQHSQGARISSAARGAGAVPRHLRVRGRSPHESSGGAARLSSAVIITNQLPTRGSLASQPAGEEETPRSRTAAATVHAVPTAEPTNPGRPPAQPTPSLPPPIHRFPRAGRGGRARLARQQVRPPVSARWPSSPPRRPGRQSPRRTATVRPGSTSGGTAAVVLGARCLLILCRHRRQVTRGPLPRGPGRARRC